MTRTRRSFAPEERLSLIQEAEREGFMETFPLVTSLDKPGTDTFLSLSPEQDSQVLHHNLKLNFVQRIGG